MADTLSYLGSLTLGQAFPYALLAYGHLDASLGIGLPELQAKLQGVLNMQVAITIGPPSLTATIEAAIAVLASLQLAIGGPTVTLQATALAALLLEIQASLGTLTAGVTFAAELQALLGTAGLHAYSYVGAANGVGPLLTIELAAGLPGGGPTDNAGGLVFIASAPAPRVALSTFCGVSIAV